MENKHSQTLAKPNAASIAGPFHVSQAHSHFPVITMTVTNDQTLQTHAQQRMPIKKKSQKHLKKQKRARALKVGKAWFDRLEVAAAVEEHTSSDQSNCVHDEPEVVEQCDDNQDQAVIEDQLDVEDAKREQRKTYHDKL